MADITPPLSPTISPLRAALASRFDLLDETFDIGPRRYTFTRVADPERVLDDVIAAEGRGEIGRMPYWAELWESALGIGHWLCERPEWAADRRVLDLGCGMGFAGMIAASLGGRVLFADIEPDSLPFALLNAQPWQTNAIAKVLDWQTARLDDRFDLIIGADVLYDRSQWDHLEPFWRHHLAPGGAVLLGEPSRQTGTPFADWIRSCGWTIDTHAVHLEERSKTIRLFVLQR